MFSNKLKKYLQMIIPAIEGKWFISDGALLGIKREGGLLEFDDDIDIFLLPDTIINYDKIDLKLQKDYMCNKLYNGADCSTEVGKLSDWRRYLSFKTSSPELQGFNRADTMAIASVHYRNEVISNINCSCWVDIFTLEHDRDNERYVVPWYFGGRLFYYTYDDLELVENYDLGFKIYIPNNAEEILERQYGKDWGIENKNYRW